MSTTQPGLNEMLTVQGLDRANAVLDARMNARLSLVCLACQAMASQRSLVTQLVVSILTAAAPLKRYYPGCNNYWLIHQWLQGFQTWQCQSVQPPVSRGLPGSSASWSSYANSPVTQLRWINRNDRDPQPDD